MVTVANRKPDSPPIQGWDEKGARELEPLLNAGNVDLPGAMLWEVTHGNRSLVVSAIQRAIAGLTGVGEEESGPVANPADGFVAPLPEDAKGVK